MKDLFKKKGDTAATPKAPKEKKPLFSMGKKAAANGAEKPAKEKAAKKPAFSFGKKADGAAKPAKKPAFSLGKKSAAADGETVVKAPKAKGGAAALDVNKLIPILVGLLVLVLAALAAKIFLFSDEPEPAPVVTAPAAPEAAPTPDATAEAVATPEATAEATATDSSVAVADPNAATPTAEATTAPEAVAAVDGNTAVATDGTTAVAAAATATAEVPPRQVSYAEFLEQSNQRIYRERTTTDAVATAEATATGQ